MKTKKNTLTREHLARAIKRDAGLPINRSLEIVDQVFDALMEELVNDGVAKIRSFGTFSVRRKNARLGRNPKSLVEAIIPERIVARFKVAPTLKKRINSNVHLIS